MSTFDYNRRDNSHNKVRNFLRNIRSALCILTFLCAAASLRFSPVNAQEPDHEHTSVNPKTDALWEQSDKAFHDGDYEKAVKFHRQIVKIDPHDVESFSVASWLLWSMGKKDDALVHLSVGLKANETNWSMWDEAGQHYQLQAGMRDPNPQFLLKAKHAYERAVALFPADSDKNDAMMLRRRLAHAAEKADDNALALATWQKLVADYPDDVVNKNNLARLERSIAEKQADKVKTAAAYAAGGAAFLAFVGAGAILRNNQQKRAAVSCKQNAPQSTSNQTVVTS